MSGYKIVHETWLTKFVASYGDTALKIISETLYQSGVFKLALLTCSTFSILSIAWSLQAKQFSRRGFFFFFAFSLLYPSQGKPAGFIVVNALGRAVSGTFESAINKIVVNSGSQSESNLPPGLVLEMVTAAATSTIQKPQTQALVYGFIVNCLPNALTISGDKASFDDIFNFEPIYTVDDTTSVSSVTFHEKRLNVAALKNDDAYSNFDPGKNCFQGLTNMREALVNDLNDQPTFLTERVIGGSRETGEEITSEAWFKKWEQSSSRFKNLAMNLKLAHAASYEKSKLISEQGFNFDDLTGNWWQRNSDASLREMLIGIGSYSTGLGFRLSDLKNIIPNATDTRWSFSLGASIKDLKERIELVPYYTATIQLLLKILCPIFLLTLLFQTTRFFFIWSGAWIASLLLPAIISASRAIHNSIILSKLGIANLLSSSGHSALAYGVDLSQAKELLSDFVPLAYSMVELELKIIQALSGAILLGSWLAGGGANGFVSWISSSIQGTMTSAATSKAASAVGSMPVLRNLAVGAAIGGPAIAAGSAAFALVNNMRKGSDSSASFNQMFPKRQDS